MGKVVKSGASEAAEGEDFSILPDSHDIARHPYRHFSIDLKSPAVTPVESQHSVTKTDARLSFLLAFPDVYEIGMSHLGFKILVFPIEWPRGCSCRAGLHPWIDCEKGFRGPVTLNWPSGVLAKDARF